MAERSFKKKVEPLRIGAGEAFRGAGILVFTKQRFGHALSEPTCACA